MFRKKIHLLSRELFSTNSYLLECVCVCVCVCVLNDDGQMESTRVHDYPQEYSIDFNLRHYLGTIDLRCHFKALEIIK